MIPAKDPKYKRCRQEQHSPDPGNLSIVGGDIVSTCTICGAQLTVSHPEWWGAFDTSACCDVCEEGAPHCSCEGGPIRLAAGEVRGG